VEHDIVGGLSMLYTVTYYVSGTKKKRPSKRISGSQSGTVQYGRRMRCAHGEEKCIG
jgi:hypothetical protein